MSDKFLKQFLIVNSTERKTKTKGFVEKTMQLRKKGKDKKITLEDVKKLAEIYDKDVDKKGGRYLIRARNIYRDNTTKMDSQRDITIRDSNGKYIDDDPEYYEKKNYDRDKYNEFFTIQIVYSK